LINLIFSPAESTSSSQVGWVGEAVGFFVGDAMGDEVGFFVGDAVGVGQKPHDFLHTDLASSLLFKVSLLSQKLLSLTCVQVTPLLDLTMLNSDAGSFAALPHDFLH